MSLFQPTVRRTAVWLLLVGLLLAFAPRDGRAQPRNDDWFAPTLLTNVFGGSIFDDNVLATKNGGGFFSREPDHSGNPGGASVWYQWTPQISGTGTIRVTNQGGMQSNLFAVYPSFPYAGAFFFNSPLTGSVVASNAVPGGFTNLIQFPIVGGQTYLIAVDGFNSGVTTNQGSFQLEYGLWDNDVLTNARSLPGSLGQLSFSTFGATNEVGEPFHGGTNDPGGASVWFAWTAPLSGPATFQVTPTTFFTLTNMLMAVYTNSSGTTNLSTAALGFVTNNFRFNTNVVLGVTNLVFNVTNRLTFDAVAGMTYYLAVDGRNVNFTPRQGVFTLDWSSRVSDTAGQFQMGPITDGAVWGSRSSRSFGSGFFGGGTNVYAVTENESIIGWGSLLNDIYDPRGAVITITRTNGAMGRMAIGYATRDVTALSGYDYVGTNGVVIFDDYQMSTNIVIRILQNFNSTNDSYFEVVLTNAVVDTNIFTDIAGNSYVESPALQPTFNFAPMTVLIRNVEIGGGGLGASTAGTINFYRAHYRMPEYAGQTRLSVVREGGDRSQAATVNYHINSFDASDSIHGAGGSINFRVQPGSDYGLVQTGGFRLDDLGLASYAAPGVVTIAANDSEGVIRFEIRNDTTVEFNEDVIVTLDDTGTPASPSPRLANGSGYSLGPQSVAVVTILYEDERGAEQPAGAADNTHNLDNDSTTDPPFNLLPGANNVVYGVAIQPDNRSVIVGDFTAFNTRPLNRIARMLTNGQYDVSFTPGSGADNFINAVVLQPDGKILIGGGFSSYTGLSRNGIARLNADGTLDASFNPGAGVNSGAVAANPVQAIALQPDGKVLIAGNFTTVNNLNYARVARLNADGSVDRTFVPGFGANDRVNAITVNTNAGSPHFGKIIIGGAFTAFNRVSRNGVAVLNPDGTVDTTVFNHLGVGANGAVSAVVVQPDDRILLGGAFTTIDFRPRAGVARLNVDGSVDATFDPGSGADQAVYSMALQPDQAILIGGSFNVYNQTRRMGVARLYPSGILDTTFLDTAYNQFAGITTPITTMPRAACYALAVQTDGRVIIGGRFTRVGGGLSYPRRVTRADISFRNNVARLIGGFTPGPGNVEFVTPSYTMDEGGGTLFVTLNRTNGFLGAATVYFNTTNGTANVGTDYVGATNQALTWASTFFDPFVVGEELAAAFYGPNNNLIDPRTSNQVSRAAGTRLLVAPIQDRTVEGNEIFLGNLTIPALNSTNPPILNLGGEPVPIGLALGRQSSTFTVSDDDFLFGDIGFSTATYTAAENAVAAVITVVRTNGITGTVTIRYTASAGPGATLANFIPVSGILTFAPGQTNQTFSVPVLDDTVTNGTRVVNLTLFSPTGGATTNGTITAATLNILDNEPPAGTPAGSVNTAFGNGVGPDGSVLAVTYIANLPPAFGLNGKWLIAGEFRVVDRIPRPGMALLNIDGSVETTIFTQFGDGPDGAVFSQAIHTNAANTNLYGRIVIGGSFLNVDGTPRPRIARLNSDGSLDTVFNPSAGADNPVYSLAIQPDDRIVIGGDFNTYNGAPRVRVARLNQDGSIDPTFSSGQGADALVRVVVVEPSGSILVGGDFSFFDGVPLPYLVRLTAAGTVDPTFAPVLNGRVRSLTLDGNTNIVVTGDFTMVGGTAANRITRLLPNGQVDPSFIATGTDRPVYSVAVDLAGNLIIAGDFNTVNGFARTRVARLTASGELDSSINFGTGPNNFVAAVALEPVTNGLITIGGGFTEVDNVPRSYVAQLLNGINAGAGQLQFAATNFTVNENGQTALVTVRRVGGLTNSLSVDYATVDGTAVAGVDYLATAGTLVFAEGEAALSYTVTIANNSVTNVNKVLGNVLANATNLTSGVAAPGALGLVTNATLVIVDDDSVFSFTFPTYSVSEGVVGGSAVISVSRLGGVLGNMTVNYSTSNLTATAGLDYLGVTNGTLLFTNGQNTASFLVSIVNDALVEGNESIQLTLSNPNPETPSSSAGLGRFAAELRIVDDDFSPGTLNFALSSYTVDEAATNVTLTVVRTNGSTGLITVRYNTLDGTALAGLDYTSSSGALTFGDGETVKTFVIPIRLDTISEPSETFDVVLSGPTGNAQLGALNSARVTIINNDIATYGNLVFSTNAYSVPETNGTATVTINRIGGTNGQIAVNFTTSAGTGIPGIHYAETSQTVTFTNGQRQATVAVPVLRSPLVEGDKTVNLTLGTVTGGASLGIPNAAILTVRDVDSSPGTLGFVSAVFSYAENQTNALITVERTNGFSGVVSIQYMTTNLTATAGTNYVAVVPAVTNVLVFTNGQTRASFGVPLIDNNFYGGDVAFGVRLFNVTGGAGVSLTNATVRIVDNESPGGSLDVNFNSGAGANGPIFALGQTTNNAIVIGGDFTAYNGVGRTNVARLNADGTLDTTFDAGPITARGTNSAVRAVVVYQSGTNANRVLIGGVFDTVNGVGRTNIARLRVDGTLDPLFDAGLGPNNNILALAVQNDGRIIVAGYFTTFGGVPKNFIARLNDDGTLDPTFNVGGGANGVIRSVAIDNNLILIGGEFTQYEGVTRNHVARLNPDGSLDKNFDPGTGADGHVNIVTLDPSSSGKVLIGGIFTRVAGVSRGRLARLNSDGSPDGSFNPATGADQFVSAFAVQPNGAILAGGGFQNVENRSRNRLARLLGNGLLDYSINVGSGANDFVSALALQADGKILVAGGFTVFDGVTNNYIARLNGGVNAGEGSFVYDAANFLVNETGTNVTVTVRRFGGLFGAGTNSVGFATQDGTASSLFPNPDYQATNGTLEFLPGEVFKTFVVPVLDNALVDGDRVVNLVLSNPSGTSTLGVQNTATATILDNDSVVGFSAPGFSVNENATNATITVRRAGGRVGAVSVEYFSQDRTAIAGTNYSNVSGTLTWADGDLSAKSFTVPIIDNATTNLNRTLELFLTNLTGSAVIQQVSAQGSAVLTIVDDESGPGVIAFSATNYFVSEAAGSFAVTVVRTNGSFGPVSADFFSTDGTAVNRTNYSGASGRFFWADGDITAKTFTLGILDDVLPNADRTINLTLANPAGGAVILESNAVVNILDDDTTVTFSAPAYSVDEAAGVLPVTVLRNGSTNVTVSVRMFTGDGTAFAGVDYLAVSTNLVFTNGVTSLTVPVVIVDDPNITGNHTFNLLLTNLVSSPSGASGLGDSNVVATILDNDAGIQFSAANYNVREDAGRATITVTRTGLASSTVAIDFAVSNLTAVAGLHYVATNGTLTFAPGVTTRSIDITLIDNTVTNADRTVQLILRNPVGPVGTMLLNPSVATLTILDNEALGAVAGSLDLTFNYGLGANGPVNALAFNTNGQLVVAGDFTTLNGALVNRVGRLNADGTVDASFNPGLGPNGVVFGAAVQAQRTNAVIIGGAFSGVNGTNASYLARLRADGTLDSSFTTGVGPDNTVFAVAVQPDGAVLLGGAFITVNGTNLSRIARVDADGVLDPSFNPGAGANGIIRAIAVQQDGRILIGGDFTSFNGTNLNRIARLNADGSLDNTFVPGFGADGPVNAIQVTTNGTIVVGGAFVTFNGFTRNAITQLNPDGSLDGEFTAGVGANGPVNAIGLRSDGKLIVAGDFTEFNGLPIVRVVRLEPHGGVDDSFDAGSGPDNTVTAVAQFLQVAPPVIPIAAAATGARRNSHTNVIDTGSTSGVLTLDLNILILPDNLRVYYDGQVLRDTTFLGLQRIVVPYGPGNSTVLTIIMNEGNVGGSVWSYSGTVAPAATGPNVDRSVIGGLFRSYDGVARDRLALLTDAGPADTTYGNGRGAGVVTSIGINTNAARPDLLGKLVIGGSFNFHAGVALPHLARLNQDGTVDLNFNTGLGLNAGVNAVAVQGDGRVVAGGYFSFANGVSRNAIARFNTDGTLDATFNPGFGANNPVFAVALQADGRALIGGLFTVVNTTARNYIARLNLDGTVDAGFNPGTGPNDGVRAVAVQADGKIIIAGDFTAVAGVPRNRVARLNANGTLDASFNPVRGLNGPVNTVLIDAAGGILVGGTFTQAEGVSRNYLARYDANGALDPSFNATGGPDDFVSTLSRQADGKLIVGGGFSSVSGLVRSRLARLNADGTVDPTINFGVGANNAVAASLVQFHDGRLVVGGAFTTMEGVAVPHLARINAGNNSGAGVLAFELAAYSASESAGTNAVLTVLRTGGLSGVLTGQLSVAGGTATNGVDYLFSPLTLTFTNGQSLQQVVVPILDGLGTNVDRTINFAVVSAGQTNGTTLTIRDNDAEPGFSLASYSVLENEGSALITVRRLGGTADAYSVQFATRGGSAVAGVDYAATNGTLVWADGDATPRTFSVVITDNSITNLVRTIGLELANATNLTLRTPVALGGQSNAVLTIVDNEFGPGEFLFSASAYSVLETAPFFQVTVIRTNGSSGPATVRYATANITATAGTNYVATSGLLTFADGETVKTFPVGIINDLVPNGSRTVALSLNSPSPGARIIQGNAVLTILDDDLAGGSVDPAFVTGSGFDGSVLALARTLDGSLLVGGDFTSFNGVTNLNRLVRLTADGLLDTNFNTGGGFNAAVSALVLRPDGRLILGGQFTNFVAPLATNPASFLVGLGTNGAADGAFNLGTGPNNAVFALALQPDGKVVIGGQFSSVNGTNRTFVARLLADGRLDPSFNPLLAPNQAVRALAVQADGMILLGGDFTAVNGFNHGYLARVTTNGLVDASFIADANGPVYALLVQPDGGILVGGDFAAFNAVPMGSLARVNPNGTLDATFTPGTGANDFISMIVRRPDGRILLGGGFSTFNGLARNFVAQLTAGGVLDPAINFGTGADNFVAAAVVLPDEKVVLGGGFTVFNGVPQNRITRVSGRANPDAGLVGFSAPNYFVAENARGAEITLVRQGGLNGSITVTNVTTPGGANPAAVNVDYRAVSNVFTFVPGQATTNYTIQIIDTLGTNVDRTVQLGLSGATGTVATALLTIVDNDAVPGFESAAYTVAENAGQAAITVLRLGGGANAISVNYSVTNGTAVSGLHFVPTGGVLTWADGDVAPKTFFVTVFDNLVVDGPRTVNLSLFNPSNLTMQATIPGLARTAAILTIADNEAQPGQLTLSTNRYLVNEGAGFVDVPVNRVNGSAGTVSVNLNTVDETALFGQDYDRINTVVVFADGEVSKLVRIGVTRDGLFETNETFRVVLSSPTGGATLGAVSNATVVIADNVVSFASPAYTISEAGGKAVIRLIRPLSSLGPLSVDFVTVSGGTAVPGLDYLSVTSTVVFADGETSQNAEVPLVDDQAFRGTRTVLLQLANPAQGAVVDVGAAVLTITDNDLPTTLYAFTNSGAITIFNTNDLSVAANRTSSPYPAVIPVAGVTGQVVRVAVTLRDFMHVSRPADVDVLLVGPGGQSVVLMSGAGTNIPVNGVGLAFDDGAANPLPAASVLTNGIYRPTLLGGSGVASFPAPAPAAPQANTFLGVFNGVNPNGNWSLFVKSRGASLQGVVAGGWQLDIVTSVPPVTNDLAVVMFDTVDPLQVGGVVTYLVSVENHGPNTANNVFAFDTLPAQMNFLSGIPSQGTIATSNGVVIVNFGAIANGSVATVLIAAQTLVPGTFTNYVNVVGVDSEANPADNAAAEVTTVSPASVSTGSSLTRGITPTTNANLLAATLTGGSSAGLTVQSASLSGFTNAATGATSAGLFNFGPPPALFGLPAPGVVLSTGDVRDYGEGTNGSPAQTTDFGVAATPAQQVLMNAITGPNAHFDVTQLDIRFAVQPGYNQVAFNLVFGSEEWPTFVGQFNDGFGIFLNGTNIAFTAGRAVNIDHPGMTTNISANEVNGVLAPGGNAVLTFTAPVVPGSSNNVLSFVIGDTLDGLLDTTVFISSLRALQAQNADLSVSVSAVPEPVFIGSNLTYSITVNNLGPAVAPNVVLQDVLPPEFHLTSVVVSQGILTITNRTLVFSLGNLGPNGFALINVVGTVLAEGVLTNLATVTSDLPDFDAGNNVSTALTTAFPFSGFNATRVPIADGGPALLYPSVIRIAGYNGLVDRVTVTLTNLNHANVADVDILLVGPQGQKVLLMSDVGTFGGATNAILTFDDLATNALPQFGGVVSGRYRPTDFSPAEDFSLYPPAPAGPYAAALSAFRGTDPNGDWKLFIVDDQGRDLGELAGGWRLTFESPPPPVPLPALQPQRAGNALTFTWPIGSFGYVLESTTTVGPAAVWVPEAVAPTNDGVSQRVTLPISGGVKFFRLRKL